MSLVNSLEPDIRDALERDAPFIWTDDSDPPFTYKMVLDGHTLMFNSFTEARAWYNKRKNKEEL